MKSQKLSPIGRDDAAGRNVLMFLPTATTPLDRGLVLMLAIMIVIVFIESHMVFLWQSFLPDLIGSKWFKLFFLF